MLWLVWPLKSIFKVILWCIYLLVCCGTSDLVYEVKLLHVCAYKVKEEKEDICRGTITLRLLNYGLQLPSVIEFSCCTIVNWLLECFPSLQALLQRTLNDYRSAGYDPQSSSLEIRLIQSQDNIRNPQVAFKAEKFN